MNQIDRLSYRSNLRTVSTGEKGLFSAVSLLICIISRSLLVAAIVLVVNGFLTVRVGGIPRGYYQKMMRIPLGFLLLATVTMILHISKIPLNGYAIPIGSYYLTASRESLLAAVQLMGTALASVSCLYFQALNTPMIDTMEMFQRLRCPMVITELMLLMYRFIFVLSDTASAIRNSQKSRLGDRDYRIAIRSFGLLGATLFIRALKRSNAIYDAMESRGYDGRIPVLHESNPPRKVAIAGIMSYGLILLGIRIGGII